MKARNNECNEREEMEAYFFYLDGKVLALQCDQLVIEMLPSYTAN